MFNLENETVLGGVGYDIEGLRMRSRTRKCIYADGQQADRERP